jgi:hypothetical protein
VSREPGERGASGVTTARLAAALVRSRPVFAAAAILVTITIAATVAGSLSLSGPPPSATVMPTEAAAPTTDAATAPATAPADPRGVFRDPALRTLAEPFLAGPGVRCEQGEPAADTAERVTCDLGGGRTGVFARMLTPDVMRDQRRGVVAGERAEPGTVLSVRWRYVEGRPGTRAGIPAGENDRGEGVRVRFIDREGVPRLYFDQDSSGCTGDLALIEPTGDDGADLEALRTFWENPAG